MTKNIIRKANVDYDTKSIIYRIEWFVKDSNTGYEFEVSYDFNRDHIVVLDNAEISSNCWFEIGKRVEKAKRLYKKGTLEKEIMNL